jgi:hypothetical protein
MEKFINKRTGKVAFFSKETAHAGLPSHFVRSETLKVFPTKKQDPNVNKAKAEGDAIDIKPVEPLKASQEVPTESINEQVIDTDYSKEQEEPSIEQMKKHLKGIGVRFSPNIGDEKLKERYYENTK